VETLFGGILFTIIAIGFSILLSTVGVFIAAVLSVIWDIIIEKVTDVQMKLYRGFQKI
jgi:hypothetical protein